MAPFLLLFVALATASPVKRQTGGLDVNGDGLISYDEVFHAMSLHEALVALDRDGDGFLYLPQIIELWGSGDKFYELNIDGDDHLTFREIENGMTLQDFYNQFDFNGDGTLDVAESYQLEYIYETINNVVDDPLDSDGDGKLSKLEVLSHMTYGEVLTALDADGDGSMTPAELMVLFGNKTADWVAAQDDNGDGVVSTGEAHHHHMKLENVFDIVDLDGSTYLEAGEDAGFYIVWDIILNMPSTDPIIG
ncbi:calcium-binding protein LPS1-beta-like [Branchiostoma lanceolatum]|uniref:calcium-binding protein LPS1-beta-like n=1 Tax=Branchiostoma lanceolatum TaxID=7740 RepID=UPI003455B05F